MKRTIERTLAAGGPASVARRSRVGQVLVLGYHNIVPHGESSVGDRSLHLPQRAFAEQLDALLETHHVIGLDELLSGPRRRSKPKPMAIVTFDDAYLGAMTAGIDELATRNLPATVFVAPRYLGGASFWWDALAGERDLDPALRASALVEARGVEHEIRAMAASWRARANEVLPPWARCASEVDIGAAVRGSRLILGSHTWSHPNLTRLTDGDLAHELQHPWTWLKRYGDRFVPVISYPYGIADARVQDAARRANYRAGFMITGGWTTPTFDGRYDIPRMDVPSKLSRDGFVLRAAGILAH